MRIFFLIIASITLISHSIFLFRGVVNKKNSSFKPQKIDRYSRNISTILLVPLFTIGTIVIESIIISLIIWTPIILIGYYAFNRDYVIKHPYMLPITNFIFLIITLGLSINELICH